MTTIAKTLNNRDNSIKVLCGAKPGAILVVVLTDERRETRLLQVTDRKTSFGRHGGTTLTLQDITRENGKTFTFEFSVSSLPENVLAAHTVVTPHGTELEKKLAARKEKETKSRVKKALATRAANKAAKAALVAGPAIEPAAEVAAPEAPAAEPASAFAVPATLGGDVFTPGV